MIRLINNCRSNPSPQTSIQTLQSTEMILTMISLKSATKSHHPFQKKKSTKNILLKAKSPKTSVSTSVKKLSKL